MSDTNNSRQSAKSLTKALTDFCLSDSLSEDGLREINERHECASPNRNPNIDYKFFLVACINERVNEGIIRYLLEYFPGAASATDKIGSMPLHYAVLNKNITLDIVKLLIDDAPNSIRVDVEGWMPLHLICSNRIIERVTAEIIQYLLESFPDTASATSKNGWTPLHCAVLNETLLSTS
jgi:ankyrin repeat protein